MHMIFTNGKVRPKAGGISLAIHLLKLIQKSSNAWTMKSFPMFSFISP